MSQEELKVCQTGTLNECDPGEVMCMMMMYISVYEELPWDVLVQVEETSGFYRDEGL